MLALPQWGRRRGRHDSDGAWSGRDIPLTDVSAMLNRLMMGLGTPVWRLMENFRLPSMLGYQGRASRQQRGTWWSQDEAQGRIRDGGGVLQPRAVRERGGLKDNPTDALLWMFLRG